MVYRAAVPNLFGTRGLFPGRQGREGGKEGGVATLVSFTPVPALEGVGRGDRGQSSGKLQSQPGSYQATDWYRTVARGLGAPDVGDFSLYPPNKDQQLHN